MSLSPVYDGTLSRVRIDAAALTVDDPFTRTVSNGWTTSGSGHVWTNTGTASEYSANGSRGLISVGSVSTSRNVVTGAEIHDVSVTVDMSVVVLATGGYIATGPVACWVNGGTDYYFLRCEFNPGGTITLNLFRVTGTSTSIGTATAAVTHSTGTTYTARLRVTGSLLRARFWQTSGSEPSTWDIEVVDPAPLTAPGAVGCRAQLQSSNTNTLPVVPQFDNFSAIPTVDVERSTDQIRWSTVRGGAGLTPVSGAISLDDYEFVADVPNFYRALDQTASITPTLDGVWLKSIARPFLNRQVTVADFGDITRPARAGVFEVDGRSLPVAVSAVRGSRRWTLDVLTQTLAEASDIDLVLASGDPLFVHVPADSPVPGGYVTVGDTTQRRTGRTSLRRVHSLPCTEAAAPGPDVVGATVNWQTVINTYATWSDVLAAHATWADMLELIGSPTDVLVP